MSIKATYDSNNRKYGIGEEAVLVMDLQEHVLEVLPFKHLVTGAGGDQFGTIQYIELSLETNLSEIFRIEANNTHDLGEFHDLLLEAVAPYRAS